MCKSKAVQQSKIKPLFRVPWQEKTVSQVKAEQQGKTLSLFKVPWQTKTVQRDEPGPLLQASQKNPTFNEAVKEENVIVEQGKEVKLSCLKKQQKIVRTTRQYNTFAPSKPGKSNTKVYQNIRLASNGK